jgi:hypothetical protein
VSAMHPTQEDPFCGLSLGGFEADPDGLVELPSERTDTPLERRQRAALIVLAIGRGCTPEEVLMDDVPAERFAAVRGPLELQEASCWVDLLLDVLSPRAEELC